MFTYRDPRLRHLNKDFRREELQVSKLDLTASKQDKFKSAIDEIIKFNCFTNEFNYMYEAFTKMRRALLPKHNYSWEALFGEYDKNKDGLLDKGETKQLMVAVGLPNITDAENNFAFNVIANHGRHLTKKVFFDWVESMQGRGKKRLIYYSQYLDLADMRIKTPAELAAQERKESEFYRVIRGDFEEGVEDRIPRVVKFLANEMHLVGESFIRKAIERHSSVDENDSKYQGNQLQG